MSEYTDEELDFARELFAVSRPEIASSDCPVIVKGDVSIGSDYVSLNQILLDSGATGGSYISKEWVDQRRAMFTPYLRRVVGMVRLGDNKTLVPVKEILRIETTIPRVSNGELTTGRVDFAVMEMNGGLDAIIGLPDILRSFLQVFIDALEGASEMPSGGPELSETLNMMSVDELKTSYPDVCDTWSQPLDEVAIEEINTEEPCSFTGPLYYLSKPHTEVLQDYFNLFDSHIAPEWRNNSRLISILSSEKAQEVFVPKTWRGILGLDPIEFEFDENMPKVHKPHSRPMNPKTKQAAEAEFERMCTYMYVDSHSPIACPLVVAPKATAPFIRICGDYVWVNRYIRTGQYFIPHVMKTLEKASGFSHFMDLDLTNSFHQLLLGEKTSNILSVNTAWGLKRPLYLPEGVAPASGMLQRAVMQIFDDFEPWCICIFDNILVLCNGIDDGLDKLQKIIDRCHERQVVLKFSKSWIGFQEAKFFGYKVREGSYGLDADRKEAVLNMQMPANTKEMQRFLGTALFFNEFVPNYSEETRHLYDMIKDGFIWDKTTWLVDYEVEFHKVKEFIASSTEKYFPDYEKTWILRVDASENACGSVLLQVLEQDGKVIHQPLGFKSYKFSNAASRWDIHKKEAFAVYHGVKSFAYYLRMKAFIIETDHANLLFMEKSEASIVIRWRVYLQSFRHVLRKISGKLNIVADWASRLYALGVHDQDLIDQVQDLETSPVLPLPDDNASPDSVNMAANRPVRRSVAIVPFPPWCVECGEPRQPEDYISMVHNSFMTHAGARRTWKMLGIYFPGHRIPFSRVQSFVRDCPRCQKDARRMVADIKPVIRTVVPPANRFRVGIDLLTVTPQDSAGNVVCIVVVNLRTKLCAIYPSSSYSAEAVAAALMRYICTYGLVDEVVTDPGSHFMNQVIETLNGWLGIRHIVSLVDVHESCGVERTNGEILQHLRALVNDKRMRDQWSAPQNLSLIEFALNDRINSETGRSAFELTFGSADAKYFSLPDVQDTETISNAWLRGLNDNLRTVREITATYQRNLIAKRTKHNPSQHSQRQYVPGDLVLYDELHDGKWRRHKLQSRLSGPFEVLSHNKNDVECRHLIMKNIRFLRVDRLTLYSGGRIEAEQLAKEDADQYSIIQISAYRGNPAKRNSMEFEITFEDGETKWRAYDRDLFNSVPYEDYCKANRELFPLLFDVDKVGKEQERINSTIITEVEPGQSVYINIRYFGFDEFDDHVPLPDKYHHDYVIKFTYKKWAGTKRLSLDGFFPLLGTRLLYNVNHLFVYSWGYRRDLTPSMIELTEEHIRQFPRLINYFIGSGGPHRANLRKRLNL